MLENEYEYDESLDNADNEATENEQDESTELEETQEESKPKSKDVPLSRFLEEKQKRKELEKRLRNYENNELKGKFKEKWLGKGFEDDYAEEQANIEYRIHLQDQKLREMEIDSEISDLAKDDDYFADAISYKSEIKAKMKEKNLSAEEAYLILRKKSRDRELATDNEQKEILRKRSDGVKQNNLTSSSASPKNPYPLDAADKKALAGLQRMQPDAGWTAEKFYKSRYQK